MSNWTPHVRPAMLVPVSRRTRLSKSSRCTLKTGVGVRGYRGSLDDDTTAHVYRSPN